MRILKLFVFLVTAATVALLAGCTTASETGRSQLLLLDPVQEAWMGLNPFQEMKSKKPIVAKGP